MFARLTLCTFVLLSCSVHFSCQMYVEARQFYERDGGGNCPPSFPTQQCTRISDPLPLIASKDLQDYRWTSMPNNNLGSRPEPFPQPVLWRGRREVSPIPSDLGAGKRGFMLVSEGTGRRWHAVSSVRVCQFGEVSMLAYVYDHNMNRLSYSQLGAPMHTRSCNESV